jgi:hypothetical protein
MLIRHLCVFWDFVTPGKHAPEKYKPHRQLRTDAVGGFGVYEEALETQLGRPSGTVPDRGTLEYSCKRQRRLEGPPTPGGYPAGYPRGYPRGSWGPPQVDPGVSSGMSPIGYPQGFPPRVFPRVPLPPQGYPRVPEGYPPISPGYLPVGPYQKRESRKTHVNARDPPRDLR